MTESSLDYQFSQYWHGPESLNCDLQFSYSLERIRSLCNSLARARNCWCARFESVSRWRPLTLWKDYPVSCACLRCAQRDQCRHLHSLGLTFKWRAFGLLPIARRGRFFGCCATSPSFSFRFRHGMAAPATILDPSSSFASSGSNLSSRLPAASSACAHCSSAGLGCGLEAVRAIHSRRV